MFIRNRHQASNSALWFCFHQPQQSNTQQNSRILTLKKQNTQNKQCKISIRKNNAKKTHRLNTSCSNTTQNQYFNITVTDILPELQFLENKNIHEKHQAVSKNSLKNDFQQSEVTQRGSIETSKFGYSSDKKFQEFSLKGQKSNIIQPFVFEPLQIEPQLNPTIIFKRQRQKNHKQSQMEAMKPKTKYSLSKTMKKNVTLKVFRKETKQQ